MKRISAWLTNTLDPHARTVGASHGLLSQRALGPRLGALPTRRRKPHKVYGQIGDLCVRLAQSRRDILRAQRLRYQVFYEEMSANPTVVGSMRRLDQDPYDAVCDHLLVIDRGSGSGNDKGPHKPWRSGRTENVVGTYRVLRQEVAQRTLGFYTASEYDIQPLIDARSPEYRFMELGRSCVLQPYRTKRSVELLWQGLWTYVREHKVDVMLGCASFSGADPREHAMALSFLHHNAMAPEDWRCRAHDHLYNSMDLLPKDQVNPKEALKALPPLIKGYLRLGAFVGDGAVIDHQFGTTDVLIILPVEKIDPRYFEHFGSPDEFNR